jgi:hypothetical protein
MAEPAGRGAMMATWLGVTTKAQTRNKCSQGTGRSECFMYVHNSQAVIPGILNTCIIVLGYYSNLEPGVNFATWHTGNGSIDNNI